MTVVPEFFSCSAIDQKWKFSQTSFSVPSNKLVFLVAVSPYIFVEVEVAADVMTFHPTDISFYIILILLERAINSQTGNLRLFLLCVKHVTVKKPSYLLVKHSTETVLSRVLVLISRPAYSWSSARSQSSCLGRNVILKRVHVACHSILRPINKRWSFGHFLVTKLLVGNHVDPSVYCFFFFRFVF